MTRFAPIRTATAAAFGLLLGSGLLFSATALAQSAPEGEKDAARASLLTSLRRQYQPFHETTKISKDGGREDAVMHVRGDWDAILKGYYDAYRFNAPFQGSDHCTGFFVAASKRLSSFSIVHKGHVFTLLSQETADGIMLTVWGLRSGHGPRVAPTRQPRPYYRGVPEAPIRSYGL